MLTRIFGKLLNLLAGAPILRTILIVFSVFYVIKSGYIYSQQKKGSKVQDIEYEPTEQQIKYKEEKTWNSIILTGVLLTIYIALRFYNSRAEPNNPEESKAPEKVEEEDEGELWRNSDDEHEKVD